VRGTASFVQRLPYMLLQADTCRQRAVEALRRAAQAKDLSTKSAFEDAADCWLLLAGQVEWINSRKSSIREEWISKSAVSRRLDPE
jgi:hypothetical protein